MQKRFMHEIVTSSSMGFAGRGACFPFWILDRASDWVYASNPSGAAQSTICLRPDVVEGPVRRLVE